MVGTLYLKALETPAGNRGLEWLCMVPVAAVLNARQAAEDARRRANAGQRESEAGRLARALQRAAGEWIKDREAGRCARHP